MFLLSLCFFGCFLAINILISCHFCCSYFIRNFYECKPWRRGKNTDSWTSSSPILSHSEVVAPGSQMLDEANTTVLLLSHCCCFNTEHVLLWKESQLINQTMTRSNVAIVLLLVQYDVCLFHLFLLFLKSLLQRVSKPGASVGWERRNGTAALLYAMPNSHLHTNLPILITLPPVIIVVFAVAATAAYCQYFCQLTAGLLLCRGSNCL